MADKGARGQWLGTVRGALELGAPYFYSGLLRPIMPWVFARRYRRPDPWNYADSPYERRKYALKLELLHRANGKRPYGRVLELGCGEGEFTRLLAEGEVGESIVGVDVVPAALDRARRRLAAFPQVSLIQENLAHGLPRGPFDLILASEIVYYLGIPRRVAVFAGRVVENLAPGGCVLLVSAWPAARVLHRPFSRRRELSLAVEHVERDPYRPYLIQVLRKEHA